MRLVATYSMNYGLKGPMDEEARTVERGEEFEVLPTAIASAEEVGRFLIRNNVAMTPEAWAKRKPISDINARWADDFCAKARDANAARRSARGA